MATSLSKSARDMVLGEVGVVVASPQDESLIGHLFLRAYCGIIDLTEPRNTWSDVAGKSVVSEELRVRVLNYGDYLVLKIGQHQNFLCSDAQLLAHLAEKLGR